MFETRKGEVSEFTQKALEGVIKQVCELAGFSKSEMYRILAGQSADRLDDARDMHRALCTCNPPAAAEYRELLDSDRALVEGARGRAVVAADEDALFYHCQKLMEAINKEGRGKAEREDVVSQARKLHQRLGTFINSNVVQMSAEQREQEARRFA